MDITCANVNDFMIVYSQRGWDVRTQKTMDDLHKIVRAWQSMKPIGYETINQNTWDTWRMMRTIRIKNFTNMFLNQKRERDHIS